MYKKGKVKFGSVTDTRTENYDTTLGAFLPHSCDEWVIGGKQEIEQLVTDLQKILRKHFNPTP